MVEIIGPAATVSVGRFSLSIYVVGKIIGPTATRRVRPALHTVSTNECNYAQIEKETLSLVFTVQHFHQYLYGRQFILVSSPKPLLMILGPKTGVPSMVARRLQQWALTLSAYSYQMQFKPTQQHSNVDALSRLPCNIQQWIVTTSLWVKF